MEINAPYIKGSSITGGAQNEANLHLYLHQVASGPNTNQTVPVNPGNNNSFGMIAINDWTVCEGSDPGSKVIARAQGMHAQCGQNNSRWYCAFNMVFEDASLNGSTLEVRGAWNPPSPSEWAVVGGTGQFTLAQGIVYGKNISEDGNGRILELFIHVFYRPIEKPKMG